MTQTIGAEKRAVLVIDDELGPRESLRFLLKNDYDVLCASSVDEGLSLFRTSETAPHAVILDIKMPDRNGIEGLREIRAIDPHVSVLILTGYASLETARDAVRFGASDYLTKPFDTKEMQRIVDRHVEQTEMARHRTDVAAQLETLNRELRSELQKQQKLAAMGEISSQFVHDLATPLTIILTLVDLLRDYVTPAEAPNPVPGESGEDFVREIERAAQTCCSMLDCWRDLRDDKAIAMEVCRVRDLLAETVESMRILAAKKGGTVELVPGPDDSAVRVQRVQISRALQNLIVNAIEALPGRDGFVRVSWSNVGREVEIAVRDNGCGIPPDKMPSVFRINFTTKGGTPGRGTGLYSARCVVRQHAGRIGLANHEEGGAVATVWLPLHDGACAEDVRHSRLSNAPSTARGGGDQEAPGGKSA
jgi:signal transduction histidine kinase